MKTFAIQFYYELLKLFARKRTYMGFIAFIAIELVIMLGVNLHKKMFLRSMEDFGLDFSRYFSGPTVAFQMINYTAFSLGSLYLALVCGDIVCKEVEDGTMRMILSRPVSRLRILALKFLAGAFYSWVLALFIVLTSLAFGVLDRGLGPFFVVDPFQKLTGIFNVGVGLDRYVMATAALCFSMTTLACLGFMFSCFNMKPASATIVTLSVYFADIILYKIPFFEDIKGYFLSANMNKWSQLFQPAIPWKDLGHNAAYLIAFDIAFLAIGAIYFARRDFKS
jgi:ABC-2 type transport system permease protein